MIEAIHEVDFCSCLATGLPATLGLESLSIRQSEILDKLLLNRKKNEIAADLNISPHTVDTHLRILYKKFEVKSKSQLLSRLINGLSTFAGRGDVDYLLSNRQRQVMQYALSGASNREISIHLAINIYTVNEHLRDVFDRLGVRSKVELQLRIIRSHAAPVVRQEFAGKSSTAVSVKPP